MYNIVQKTNGNVLVLILIAVALFGALSFAVTSTSRNTDQGMVTEGQASAAASVIMQYGDEVQTALNRLITVGGCDMSEVSFDYDTGSTTGYENSNAPSNNSCHVFHPNGGGISYRAPEDKWLDGVGTGTFYGEAAFVISCVTNQGTQPSSGTCNTASNTEATGDLIMVIPYLNETICEQLVQKTMSLDTIPIDANNAFWNTSQYTGTFNTGTAPLDLGANSTFNNGCFTGDGAGGAILMPASRYAYFNVLYAQ